MIELVLTIMHSGVVQTSNRTLQRASQILGWSTNVYTASLVVIFVVVAMLSLRSIRHQLSRIRLVRLSFALVIMNTITLFLGLVFGTLAWTELVSMLIPILALLGVVLGANRADRNRMVGRHWLPVSRAVFWTMLIFFVRQAYVFLEETTVTTPAVVMKALSGLPVLILAIHMWRKRGTNLNRCTMIAIACYFTANTIINLSMPLALCAYTLGHCMLIYAYIREHKPGHIRLIVWAAVAAMLEIDLFLMAGGLNVAAKIVAVFYIAALVGVLVTGERVSKRIQLGTILFMLSNQILGITLRYPGDFLLESTELLLYYIAVIILAMDPKALMQDIPVEKKPEAEQA